MRSAGLRGIARPAIIWPLAFVLIGIFLVVLPETGTFEGIPGGLGDGRFNSFILEHVYRWMRGMEPSLWSPGFFYPYQHVLAFSDTHFGSAPIYALFRLTGMDRYASYSAWFVAGFLLNFVSANECLKRFGFGPLAAATGAFVFTFSMPMMAQSNHTQLLYRCAIPPAALAAQRFLDSRNPAYLGALALWSALQFIFGPYTGLFTMLMLGLWMAAGLALRLRGPAKFERSIGAVKAIIDSTTRRSWTVALAGTAIALIALGFLGGKYWVVAREFGLTRHYEGGSAEMLPRLGSLLLADRSLLWGWLSQSLSPQFMRDEHQLFTGFGVWILMLIAVWRSRTAVVRTALVTLLSIFLLTCSIQGYSLYWIVDALPGFSAIRFVVRIWLVALFPIAVLVSAGVGSINWRSAGAWRAHRKDVGVALAVVLVVVESTAVRSSFLPTDTIRARIDHLRAMLPTPIAKDTILFSATAPDFEPKVSEIDSMTVAQEAGIRTLNGFSGFWPPGHDFYLPRTCQQGALILSDVVAKTGGGQASFDQMARHVVTVGFDHCDPAAWTLLSPARGPLPDEVFDRLLLEVGPISDIVGEQFLAKVRIQNRSGAVLHSISLTDNPVRLGWRFVDESSGVSLRDWSNGDWSQRFDLPLDIGAGQTATVDLPILPPSTQGRFRLQVSMVQENVSWLFDHGVAPALSKDIIVRSPTSVSVVTATPPAP